jgi:lipopolysaccharide export system ATP-binding protein
MDGHDVTYLPMYRRARLGLGYLPQEASIFRGLSWRTTSAPRSRWWSRSATGGSRCWTRCWPSSASPTCAAPRPGALGRRAAALRDRARLATQPAYILLDEPLAGIDPIAVGEIRDLVKHLKDRGIGVLITDHNVRETLEIIDRAYILHDGQVLMEGSPRDIVAHEGVRRVYLGERFSL